MSAPRTRGIVSHRAHGATRQCLYALSIATVYVKLEIIADLPQIPGRQSQREVAGARIQRSATLLMPPMLSAIAHPK